MELKFTGERVVPGPCQINPCRFENMKLETRDVGGAVRQERRIIDSIEDRQRMLALGLKEAHL